MNSDEITPQISTAAFSKHILFCWHASGTCKILLRINSLITFSNNSHFAKSWLQFYKSESVKLAQNFLYISLFSVY